MIKNNLQSKNEIEDMNLNIKNEDLDLNDCPRIFGPATNYIFRKMIPMTAFLQQIELNKKAYMRIYEEEPEKIRLEELKY